MSAPSSTLDHARKAGRPRPDWFDSTAWKGPDGVTCCRWAGDTLKDIEIVKYHDEEWGTPSSDRSKVFEALSLGIFEGGLGWLTVLHKRSAFRQAFFDFDPERIATFNDRDIQKLLGNAEIIRNGPKINAIVHNAKVTVSAGESLFDIALEYRPPASERPRPGDPPIAVDPQTIALAERLRTMGFRFIGPTSVYAFMQSIGTVNCHVVGCQRGDDIDLGY